MHNISEIKQSLNLHMYLKITTAQKTVDQLLENFHNPTNQTEPCDSDMQFSYAIDTILSYKQKNSANNCMFF